MFQFLGILLALGSAVLKSSSELLSKKGFVDEINEYVLSWSLRFFAIPFIALTVLISGGIPQIEPIFWVYLSISGSISVVGTILYMKALKYSDVSIISPLGAITPMLLFVTSPLIVNEFPDMYGIIGVVLITVGVYSMKLSSATVGFFEPFRAIKRERGAKYIFGLVILYSISSNIDKLAVEVSSGPFYSLALHIFSAGFLSVIMIYHVDNWQQSVKRNWKQVLPIGALSGLSSVIQMIALSYTLVIYVLAVKRAGIVVSVIGGFVFFDEEDVRDKIIGTILIVIGVIVIALSLA